MPVLKVLPDTKGEKECKIVSSVTAAIATLRAGIAPTAAGDNGSVSTWVDDNGAYRCVAHSFRREINHKTYGTMTQVKAWWKEWLPVVRRSEQAGDLATLGTRRHNNTMSENKTLGEIAWESVKYLLEAPNYYRFERAGISEKQKFDTIAAAVEAEVLKRQAAKPATTAEDIPESAKPLGQILWEHDHHEDAWNDLDAEDQRLENSRALAVVNEFVAREKGRQPKP